MEKWKLHVHVYYYCLFTVGHEFQAVFLSTLEHLNSNGESSNPTKSLVTPRIFNTVLSRSKSLVVAIGNPFSLLKLEDTMGHSEKCWKKYLKLCLEKNSITFDTEVQARHDIKKEIGSLVGVASIRPSSSRQEQHNMSAIEQQPDYDWQTVSTKVKPQRLQESQQHRVNDYKQKKKQASSPKERDNRSSHKPPEISMEDYFPSKISQPSKRMLLLLLLFWCFHKYMFTCHTCFTDFIYRHSFKKEKMNHAFIIGASSYTYKL